GGDMPVVKNGTAGQWSTNVSDALTGNPTTRNSLWELDGYSNYAGGVQTNTAYGNTDYSTCTFNGYTQGPAYYGKTFFIWPPDPRRPLNTPNDSVTIKQSLTDQGYTATDFNGVLTGPPLNGIFNVTATPGSQNWPWSNDGGVSLSAY